MAKSLSEAQLPNVNLKEASYLGLAHVISPPTANSTLLILDVLFFYTC